MMFLQDYLRREKWTLAKILIPIFIIYCFSEFVLLPIGKNISEYQNKYEKLNENTYSHDWLKERKNYLEHKLSLLEILETVLYKNFAEDDTLYSIDKFRKFAEAKGLRVTSLKMDSTVTSTAHKYEIILTFNGSYSNFIKFINMVNTSTPAAYISDLRLIYKNGNIQGNPFKITYYKRIKK